MTSYIADLNELTAPAANDFVLVRDVSDLTDRDKKMQLQKLAMKNGSPTAGRLASWTDVNQVQDAGFLATDVARKSGTPSAGQGVSWVDANTIQATSYLTADVVRKTGATQTAGNVTRWNANNIVEDGGFAVSDIARLSIAQTFTANNIYTNRFGIVSTAETIADQAAISIPEIGGNCAFLLTSNRQSVGGLIMARVASAPFCVILCQAAAGLIDAITGTVLTGGNGTNGRITISATTTMLYLENRGGQALTAYIMRL